MRLKSNFAGGDVGAEEIGGTRGVGRMGVGVADALPVGVGAVTFTDADFLNLMLHR